jgi:hypothetical protein
MAWIAYWIFSGFGNWTAAVIAGVEAVAVSGMLVADSVYPN